MQLGNESVSMLTQKISNLYWYKNPPHKQKRWNNRANHDSVEKAENKRAINLVYFNEEICTHIGIL